MSKASVISVVLSLFVAASSFAQQPNLFDLKDQNDDMRVTKDEFYGTIDDKKIYPDMDTNGDGIIEAFEYESLDWAFDFYEWDSNEDSYLTVQEFQEGLFSEIDEDDNGFWDDDEWDRAEHDGWFDL